jgi:hypothetical protein
MNTAITEPLKFLIYQTAKIQRDAGLGDFIVRELRVQCERPNMLSAQTSLCVLARAHIAGRVPSVQRNSVLYAQMT